MARTTYLEAVNQVLAKLRREEVTTVSQTLYSKLVGQLVNQTKRKVEDSWQWTELRSVLEFTTNTTDRTYRLTNFGDRYHIHEVWNESLVGKVLPASDDVLERWEFTGSITSRAPSYWRISGLQLGDPLIEFDSTPDDTYDIKVVANVPQDDLASDATQISVPHWPIVLGAYQLALKERGEDGGTLYDEALEEYEDALASALANDNVNKVRGMDSDWYVE